MAQSLIIKAPGTITTPTGEPIKHQLINTPVAHWVPSDAGVTLGQPVLTVPSRAGGGALYIPAGKGAPTLRSSGSDLYAEFDGVDDMLRAPDGLARPSFTVLVVARMHRMSGHTTIWRGTPIPNSNNCDLSRWPDGTLRYYSGALFTSTIQVDNGWHVFHVTMRGPGDFTIGIDKLEATGNAGTQTMFGSGFGQERDNLGTSQMDLAEFAIFAPLTTAQRNAEIDNLRAVHGI